MYGTVSSVSVGSGPSCVCTPTRTTSHLCAPLLRCQRRRWLVDTRLPVRGAEFPWLDSICRSVDFHRQGLAAPSVCVVVSLDHRYSLAQFVAARPCLPRLAGWMKER